VYGATVDAEGVPVEDPTLIQSSGYEFFNREALKVIQQAEIPNESSAPQAFLITVRFMYDEAACPIRRPDEEAVS
jgi:TonB family protein